LVARRAHNPKVGGSNPLSAKRDKKVEKKKNDLNFIKNQEKFSND
jgi:hypothetical protein